MIIRDLAFQPPDLTIAVGETVTWTNRETPPHTTASRTTSEWGSPILNLDESFRHTFGRPGTFEYWCTIHPDMRGTITVR
ncbi:MAG TPA: plastocyanin/azurin family copper-binding protein [Dehalococcoidia bacterium]|nr:plastocyanin/azurin family copper-binding protein [Dehalococcoidia bacterium]